MRILPVNNYNYQSQTQNNKQKNVNFGMLFSDADKAGKLCDLAEFVEVGRGITSILTRVKESIFKERPNFRKPFEPNDKDDIALSKVLEAAAAKHAVMSPDEVEKLAKLFFTDINKISNETLIGIIKAEVDNAKSVTEPMQRQLAELEDLLKKKQDQEAVDGSGPPNSHRTLAIKYFSIGIDGIKKALYAESVAK